MTHQDRQHTKPAGHAHSHSGGSHMGMMVLCVALMAGAFLYFSGQDGGTGLGLGLLLPLIVCVGAHFLMHRFMDHGTGTDTSRTQVAPRLKAQDRAPGEKETSSI